MGGVRMCANCRRRKVKCEPERTWIEGGLQQKCSQCDSHGLECSPSQFASQQTPSRASGSQISRRTSADSAQSVQQASLNNRAGLLARAPDAVAEDKIVLKRRLWKIDERVEASKALEYQIGLADYSEYSKYTTLLLLKTANLNETLSLLRLAVSLADGLAATGETDAAENGYTRTMSGYRAIDPNSWYEVKGILRKLSSLNWKLGHDQRAQNFSWEGLQCREAPPTADRSDLDWLKELASSLSRTSNGLANIIRSTVGVAHPEQLITPIPVLHKMMESTYASDVIGNVFWTAALPNPNEYPVPEQPIIGGIEHALEFIRHLSDTDLTARDSQGRNPLFLAAELRKEALGLALMIRANEIPGMKARIMDARHSITGQTILGISIFQGCSLIFIRYLIENGVDLNPVMVALLNPLQLASWMGSLEIVDLLLQSGASVDRALADGKTALDIAREQGHEQVVQRLIYTPQGYRDPPVG